MKAVKTAELKAHLSAHLSAVRRGETITILDRRQPIARLVPFLDAQAELVVRPAQGRLQDIPVPAPANEASDVVADLLAERADRG